MQVGLRDRGEDPAAECGGFQEGDIGEAEGVEDLDGRVGKADPIQGVAVLLGWRGSSDEPQPVASASRTDAGSGRRVARSVMASRPPGLKTRQTSDSTRSLAGDRLRAQLEITTSALASSTGRASIVPRAELQIGQASLGGMPGGQVDHLPGQVDPDDPPGWSDPPGTGQGVHPPASSAARPRTR
jgi:hypothetical protein